MRRSFVLLIFALTLLPAQLSMNLKNMDLDAIDPSCKPCDDFYQFSVGRWNQRNPIPADQVVWSKRWAGADGNFDVLKNITEALAAKPDRPNTNARKIGDFYGACMATTAIDAAGAKPLEAAMKRIAAANTRSGLQRAIAELHADGIAAAIQFSPVADSENPKQTIASIAPGILGLPDRDYYLKQDAPSQATRARYVQHVTRLLTLAGLSPDRAAASTQVVVRMETDLARARMSGVDRRDPYKTTTHVPAAELERLTPHFDFASYYRAMGVAFSGVAIVRDPTYMKELDRLLDQAPIEDWRTLLTWNLVQSRARELSKPFQQEMFEFVDQHLSGQKEPTPRWRYCVQRTDELLSDALGQAYVEKVFPPAAKARMQEMVKNLLAAMGDSIHGLEWMTDATKQRALAKLATFYPKVGYPDKWRSYASLPISRASYWENVAQSHRFNRRDVLGRISKPTDRTLWNMTAPTSNASYSAVLNSIQFPAGILTPPMFSMDADDAVNYGGIGVVIGHEISHGFDDSGSQFDADGRLNNWWSPADRKLFEQRTACVVDQFNNYFIEPGVGHNGKLVLGESIGDLAGARIAYMAYMRSLQGKPRPADIGGFTPEQRFFLGWGQARGDAMRIERQRLYVVTDPHPVAKFRVIGPLSNMPEFHKAFGCKPGDAMVRPRACSIW